MLSGVKFYSRDQIDAEKGGKLDDYEIKGRTSSRKKKSNSKKRHSRCSSSDDDRLGKIKKTSKKKWYSSDEYSSSSSGDDERYNSFDDDNKLKNRKGKHHDTSKVHVSKRSEKKSKRSKKRHCSEVNSSFDSESGEEDCRGRSKGKNKVREDDEMDNSDDAGPYNSANDIDIVRKEMGLEWMVRPAERAKTNFEPTNEQQPEELPSEERVNPKELNPYLRNHGSGYPEDVAQTKFNDKLLSSSLVGDGGASWRLKALKRAQEQATREGRNLEEVAQERWGSLGHLAVTVASDRAAAPRAHLRAIRCRKLAPDEVKSDLTNQNKGNTNQETAYEYLKDVSVRHPEMRAPLVHDSLSWGKRKGQIFQDNDADIISKAVSSINKFANDGDFMKQFTSEHDKAEISPDLSSSLSEGIRESVSKSEENKYGKEKQPLSANQLAAKAMQLRLKGKLEEAEKLLKEAEITKVDQHKEERLTKLRNDVSTSRYLSQDMKMRAKGKEDDSDMQMAQRIMKHKQYSTSTQADDEYDYDAAPSKKNRRMRGEHGNRSNIEQNVAKRILTQQERCIFCFENPKRPKHLVVAIANFTYLMLPQYQPVAPGHCCIVTLQHEAATRMVDDNVWEEIRNFKKCLMMMFAKQDKEMVFLETVMGLAQQRRHCLIECIPLPQDIAKEAPLYFKKAIDEAEDEWSQHNSKKLIDTSQKGLRSSIPKNFPYFHVEFGLNRGFVHVIDDEAEFRSSLGLNVIRGMLQSHNEDMYRRRRYESVDVQKQAVASFAKDWGPFDWTKQLD